MVKILILSAKMAAPNPIPVKVLWSQFSPSGGGGGRKIKFTFGIVLTKMYALAICGISP